MCAFKNLSSDLFLVSGVSEVRWVVQLAFLTPRFPMIYFSNFLSPRPGERKEQGEVPKNTARLSSHLSENGRPQSSPRTLEVDGLTWIQLKRVGFRVRHSWVKRLD